MKDRYVDVVVGEIHASVRERFALPSVPQADASGPYMPAPLRHHPEFAHNYPDTTLAKGP